jgi:hypothetical protein
MSRLSLGGGIDMKGLCDYFGADERDIKAWSIHPDVPFPAPGKRYPQLWRTRDVIAWVREGAGDHPDFQTWLSAWRDPTFIGETDEPPHHTASEWARMLNISRGLFHSWAQRSDFPAPRTPGADTGYDGHGRIIQEWYVPDVEQWLKAVGRSLPAFWRGHGVAKSAGYDRSVLMSQRWWLHPSFPPSVSPDPKRPLWKADEVRLWVDLHSGTDHPNAPRQRRKGEGLPDYGHAAPFEGGSLIPNPPG